MGERREATRGEGAHPDDLERITAEAADQLFNGAARRPLLYRQRDARGGYRCVEAHVNALFLAEVIRAPYDDTDEEALRAARMSGELFRQPDVQLGFLIFGTTMGQLLSIPLLVGGIGLIVWARRQPAGPWSRLPTGCTLRTMRTAWPSSTAGASLSSARTTS